MGQHFSKLKGSKSFIGVLSGGLLALTLPPTNLSFFVFFALIPLFWFLFKEAQSWKVAFHVGFLTGFVYLSKTVYPLLSLNAWWWLSVDSVVYENREIMLFWLLYLGVLAGALLWGGFSVLVFRLRNITLLLRTIFIAFLFACMEYLRAKIVLGFTWGHIGYALHNINPIFILGGILGLYGLGALIVLINLLFTEVFFGTYAPSLNKKLFINNLPVQAIIFLGAILVFIIWFNFSRPNIHKGQRQLLIAVIQPGLSTEGLGKTPGFPYQVLLDKALGNNPDIIVLPENALPLLNINEVTLKPVLPSYPVANYFSLTWYQNLLRVSEENPHVMFIFGADTVKNNSAYNSLVVLKQGRVQHFYNKRFLVPLSETGLSGLVPVNPLGKGIDGVLNVSGINLEPLICSEVIFPNLVSAIPALVVNIGNDSVFSSPTVSKQHLIMAQMRAVETGNYLVRSMKTGVSAIIDPNGVLVKVSNDAGAQLLVGTVFIK